MKKPSLTKEQELQIAKKMELLSNQILYSIGKTGHLERIVEGLIETPPIHYLAMSRNDFRKKTDFISHFRNLGKKPTKKNINGFGINYIAAQWMAKDFYKICSDYQLPTVQLLELELIRNRNELLLANTHIVSSMAKKLLPYAKRGNSSQVLNKDDLWMIGMDALISASGRYDHRIDVAFVHFARVYVFRSMTTAGSEYSEWFQISSEGFRTRQAMETTIQKLSQDLMRRPTMDEISTATGASQYEISKLKSMQNETNWGMELVDEKDPLANDEFENNPFSTALRIAIQKKVSSMSEEDKRVVEEFLSGEFRSEIPHNERDDFWKKLWKN